VAKPKVTFLVFFLIWAERQRWTVPDVHVRACHWLETCGDLALLRCFRGFGKSTILAIYNAWRYYQNPTHRILHQGDQDKTAYKTSRDTKAVILRHPLTRHMVDTRGETAFWWVPGNEDERNPSMQASGILTNITSSRADEVQNDDVEVPRNIATPEAREKLRYRLSEQTFILVPGGRTLYIGTPHTHDSLYDEVEAQGADCLTIKMFANEMRIESAGHGRYLVPFVPEMVFAGIGKNCRLLAPGTDYKLTSDGVELLGEVSGLVDFYAGCAWPERFTPEDMTKRRKKTRTVNEWDSQYQLHSKPIHDVRLDPDRMVPYEVEPVAKIANGETVLMLGNVRLVGAKVRWDCSLGKVKSDASAVAVVFTDNMGRLYWHRAVALTGNLEEFAADDTTLIGGQIKQLIDILKPLKIPQVVIETNGPGGFVPAIARKHLKRHGIAVREDHVTSNKQKRILDAFEPPLSSGFLWAHTSVLDGPAYPQMKEFNPAIKEQPDDYVDSAAGAIADTPVRIGKVFGNPKTETVEDWRQSAGVHEVIFEA
jgi:hypothetical protein